MRTLLNKNLVYFFTATIIVLVCSFPLFYSIMMRFYAEDLDELVMYRKDDFMKRDLNTFKVSSIEIWNKYSYDLKILPDTVTSVRNKIVQQDVYTPSDKGAVEYRVLYTPIKIEGKPYVLMSRTAMIESDDLMEMIIWQYGLLFLVLLVFLSLIQWRISKKLWKPFYNSLTKIESFNLEKEKIPRFMETDTKEFIRLNDNLTKLIFNDLSIYKQQKEFIENASHELQTPLAVFRSQMDVLLQNTDLTEEQTKIVQSMYDTTSRLTRLNKNLLLLAKIENRQFKDFEEFDLTELLTSLPEFFHSQIENKNINISVNVGSPVVVKANKILTESLINNLVVNAIRYNVVGGDIFISVNDQKLTVRNTGGKELERSKIFTRFNHNSNPQKGTGLGLAIVYQICKLHGWDIQYDFVNKMHCFEVRWGVS